MALATFFVLLFLALSLTTNPLLFDELEGLYSFLNSPVNLLTSFKTITSLI